MCDKLAGMTGTAETEETEFYQIYKLKSRSSRRTADGSPEDRHDLVYKTRREIQRHRRGDAPADLGYPVLIGTTSVEAVGDVAKMFSRGGCRTTS